MLINLRNALMAGKRLPYDAELEYLESTGTQYIDTGIVGNERLIIDSVWSYGASDASAQPFGSRMSAASRAISVTGWGYAIDYRLYLNYGNKSDYIKYTSGDLYGHIWEIHIENGNSRLIRDGLVVSTGSASTSAFTTPSSLILFGGYDNGSIERSKNTRIYSWSVREGNVLVRDYIPVRKGTVGYLYDRVSGQLFGNAGTGDFVIGPDIPSPV